MKKLLEFRCFVIPLLAPFVAHGQGTLRITFDGPPLQPRGSAYNVQSYSESTVLFAPMPGSDGFGRVWTNPPAGLPNDGSPYVDAALGDSLSFRLENGSAFSLISVNLAGYSTVVPNVTAYFTGYRTDGSTVSTNFPTSDIIFRTFRFSAEWSALTRVDVPDFGSLDDLVLSVPEPHTLRLLSIAAGCLAAALIRRKNLKYEDM